MSTILRAAKPDRDSVSYTVDVGVAQTHVAMADFCHSHRVTNNLTLWSLGHRLFFGWSQIVTLVAVLGTMRI